MTEVIEPEVLDLKPVGLLGLEEKPNQPPVKVIVMKGNYHEEVDAKIVDDHYLEFETSDKQPHRALIVTEPIIFKAMYWKKKLRLVWYCGYFDEVTKDPNVLKFDLPTIEAIHSLSKTLDETKLGEKLAEEIKTKKGFLDYLPTILLVVSNICWMIYTYSLLDKVL